MDPTEDFEPSVAVKKFWLFTRKSPYSYGGREFPGLFQTSGYTMDAVLFVWVIILELWGLISLVSYIGLRNPDGSANMAGIGGIVAAVLIDIVCALVLHIPKGFECRLKNKLLSLPLDESEDPQKVTEWTKRILGRKPFFTPIFVTLIFSFAVVKGWLFYMVSEELTALNVSVLISYVLAAVIHVKYTGYFLYSTFFDIWASLEHRRWRNDGPKSHFNVTKHRRHRSPESFEMQPASVFKHELKREDAKCLLRTWGILTDYELHALVTEQGDDPDSEVQTALLCLDGQLDILDTGMTGIESTKNVKSIASKPDEPAEVESREEKVPAGKAK